MSFYKITMTSKFNYTNSSEYILYSSDDYSIDDYEDDYENNENIFTDISYMDEEYFYNNRLRVSDNIIIYRAPLPINTCSNAKRKEIEEKRKENEFTNINQETEINIDTLNSHLNWLKQQNKESIPESFVQIFEKEKIEKENSRKNTLQHNEIKIENNSNKVEKRKNTLSHKEKDVRKKPWSHNEKIENNSKQLKNQMDEKYNSIKNPWYHGSNHANKKDNLQYTNICKNILEGKKCYNNCKYAHTLKELIINDCKFKESCNSVTKKNNVYINFKGKKCNYKHPGEKLNDYYIRIGLSKFINV